MNAHTAQPEATTTKTALEDIVPTAISTTQIRIDDFLKKQLHAARSDAGYGIAESATQLERLGFTQSANVRYSKFLELFRNSTELATRYKEKYPSSIFLNWKAFHELLKVMDLRVDLPKYYRGAVPPEQIPWIEIFELDSSDRPIAEDYIQMIGKDPYSEESRKLYYVFDDFSDAPSRYHLGFIREKAQIFKTEANNNFFVVAPPEAFETKIDWLGRLSCLLTEIELAINPPPPDPLVVRMCHGGVIVVAAWGDEAELINKAAIDLGL